MDKQNVIIIDKYTETLMQLTQQVKMWASGNALMRIVNIYLE